MAACFTILSFPSLFVCTCVRGHTLCDPLYVQKYVVKGVCYANLSIWQFCLYEGFDHVARLGLDRFGLGLLLITSFPSFTFSSRIYCKILI